MRSSPTRPIFGEEGTGARPPERLKDLDALERARGAKFCNCLFYSIERVTVRGPECDVDRGGCYVPDLRDYSARSDQT